MSYCGYITKLQNVRPHSNADRMKLADCFGNTVCVGIDTPEDTLLIYFPTDGQLSAEYCEYNNLVRKKDENGNNIGGYMDPDKRNVTAIKLRGEKSDGLVMPLESLAFTGVDISTFKMGDTITVVNGHEICKKYIPVNKKAPRVSEGNRTRKKKVPIAPLFVEHADTEQLAYNMNAFKPGDEIEITLKMHGTSQRTGYLPVFKGYKRTLWDKICRRAGEPIYDMKLTMTAKLFMSGITFPALDALFLRTLMADFMVLMLSVSSMRIYSVVSSGRVRLFITR